MNGQQLCISTVVHPPSCAKRPNSELGGAAVSAEPPAGLRTGSANTTRLGKTNLRNVSMAGAASTLADGDKLTSLMWKAKYQRR